MRRYGGIFCPGPGEFPAQRPVTRSFDVFLDLRLISDGPGKLLFRQVTEGDGYYHPNIEVVCN